MPLFFDSSSAAHGPISIVGNAQVSYSTKKSGAGSLLLDGAGDYLSIPDHADWQLGGGAGAFTVEAWVRFAVLPGLSAIYGIAGQWVDGNNQWLLMLTNSAGTYRWRYYNQLTGTVTIDISGDAVSLDVDEWHHIAIVRSGNDFKLFQDGLQVGTTVTDTSGTNDFSATLRIGSLGTSNYFNGYIDELRISDSARYSGTFTPSDIFTSDANTKLLLHCDGLEEEVSDSIGTADSADAFSLTDSISDLIGIGDSSDAYNTSDSVSDLIGILEVADASREIDISGLDVAGIGDSADAGGEIDGPISDVAGIADLADGFNWSAWFRANRDRSVIRYYCTLTGANDGLSDLTIPISSFQAQKRTGESTYLSVVIPGVALADSIADRSNGELVIDMAYMLDGAESVREEILRVDLEQINPQEGARNRSITLIGHKTVTYDARAKSIQGSNYKYTSNGSMGFRFPQADPYLNPGDALTVVDTGDVFTVDYITYAIAAKGAKFMEVREG